MGRNRSVLWTLLLAVVLTTVAGCGGSTSEVEPEHQVLIETLQHVPLSYEAATLWHLGELRNDPDLDEVYHQWKEWSHLGYWEEAYGIEVDDIEHLADAGLLRIARGDFDFDAVRDRLPEGFHRDEGYPGVEVWLAEPTQDPQGSTGGVVLAEGLFVCGANADDARAYLELAEGSGFSMYDRNAAEVVERLPQGIVTRIWRDRLFEGLIVAGQCFEKEGKYVSQMTEMYRFMSPEDATNAGDFFNRMKQDLKRIGSVTLKQDGAFVQLTLSSKGTHLTSLLFPH